MKTDIDALMQTHNIDALLVTWPGQHNPAMVYLTCGAHLTNADLIKKRGEEPVLFYNPMERDEAARTGMSTKNLADYNLNELIQQFNGDNSKAVAMRYRMMFKDLGISSGRVALFGRTDVGTSYAIFSAFQRDVAELELVGGVGDSILTQCMATKDEAEVERIRVMGRITVDVVGLVADFLTSHRAHNGTLRKADDSPLTIGDVKKRINLWLAERGAENPEGTIFSIGRDAGVPHSSGIPTDPLRLGQTIIFDIFPCEAGGGYHYDFTRTWCLGYADDAALALFENVRTVYQRVMDELRSGVSFKHYQRLACDLFEAQGHPTIQSNPQTQVGYVHSVGHGLGLYVHERPFSGVNASDADRLLPGVVATIEPGLYYPEQGMGMLLEDTIWVKPDNSIDILAKYPLDLILPIK